MVEGRLKENWNHTASLMAIICNVNRSSKSKSFQPSDFMPKFDTQKSDVIHDTKAGFAALKKIANDFGVKNKGKI